MPHNRYKRYTETEKNMKRLWIIIALLFVFVLTSSVLVACIDMNEDTIIYDITQEKISTQVSVTLDKIKIT